MRSRILEEYKKKLKLTPRQQEILIGLMLGDGHLERSPCTSRARLKVEQRERARQYIDWLYENFQEWIRQKIRIRTKLLKTTNKLYRYHEFTTYSHEEFMPYRQLFYPRGKKVVPSSVDKILTPLGLAVWFMDDGSIKSHECRGRIINTHSFTEKEVELLCRVLAVKFNLEAWPRQQKDGVQVYISAKSADKFEDLLLPNILPVMQYKLPNYSS
jgi:DNA-binding transcriptional regulator WhiA